MAAWHPAGRLLIIFWIPTLVGGMRRFVERMTTSLKSIEQGVAACACNFLPSCESHVGQGFELRPVVVSSGDSISLHSEKALDLWHVRKCVRVAGDLLEGLTAEADQPHLEIPKAVVAAYQV